MFFFPTFANSVTLKLIQNDKHRWALKVIYSPPFLHYTLHDCLPANRISNDQCEWSNIYLRLDVDPPPLPPTLKLFILIIKYFHSKRILLLPVLLTFSTSSLSQPLTLLLYSAPPVSHHFYLLPKTIAYILSAILYERK